MNVTFAEKELEHIGRALPNAADMYRDMAQRERHPLDRKNIQGYSDAALALSQRVQADPQITLSPGDLSVLERCLRFEAHRWQLQIRPGMDREIREHLLAQANACGEIITRLRKARGLPF